jgi:hypothetical protein
LHQWLKAISYCTSGFLAAHCGGSGFSCLLL